MMSPTPALPCTWAGIHFRHRALGGVLGGDGFSDRAPVIELGLETVDNLVLGTGAERLDDAQVEAVRQWLVSGGNLWLMADQLDDDFAVRLLGPDWTAKAVDRLEMSRVYYRRPSPAVQGGTRSAGRDGANARSRSKRWSSG